MRLAGRIVELPERRDRPRFVCRRSLAYSLAKNVCRMLQAVYGGSPRLTRPPLIFCTWQGWWRAARFHLSHTHSRVGLVPCHQAITWSAWKIHRGKSPG